jgi:hypothetical protein
MIPPNEARPRFTLADVANRHGSIPVLSVRGELAPGSLKELAVALCRLEATHAPLMVLDLSGLLEMDEGSVRCIERSAARVQGRGAYLLRLGMRARVRLAGGRVRSRGAPGAAAGRGAPLASARRGRPAAC